MKAKVNVRLEVIEGADAGYVLEESNRLIDLERNNDSVIKPYRAILDFVTPDIMREWREREKKSDEE